MNIDEFFQYLRQKQQIAAIVALAKENGSISYDTIKYITEEKHGRQDAGSRLETVPGRV